MCFFNNDKRIKELEEKVETQAMIMRALSDVVRDLNHKVKEMEDNDKLLWHIKIQGEEVH